MNFSMNTVIVFLGYGIALALAFLLAISYFKILSLEFKIWAINRSNLSDKNKSSKLRIVDFQKMNLCFTFKLDKNYQFEDPVVREEYKDYTVQEIKTGLSFLKTIAC